MKKFLKKGTSLLLLCLLVFTVGCSKEELLDPEVQANSRIKKGVFIDDNLPLGFNGGNLGANEVQFLPPNPLYGANFETSPFIVNGIDEVVNFLWSTYYVFPLVIKSQKGQLSPSCSSTHNLTRIAYVNWTVSCSGNDYTEDNSDFALTFGEYSGNVLLNLNEARANCSGQMHVTVDVVWKQLFGNAVCEETIDPGGEFSFCLQGLDFKTLNNCDDIPMLALYDGQTNAALITSSSIAPPPPPPPPSQGSGSGGPGGYDAHAWGPP